LPDDQRVEEPLIVLQIMKLLVVVETFNGSLIA
jgi:hypothetical protein